MIDSEFIQTLIITFKLATFTTVILLLLGIPLAALLAFKKFRFKTLVEAIVNLPIVLPPTVLGFYFLVAFGDESPIGRFLKEYLNIKLVFTFEGLVVASVIYSLPFMVQPVYSAFQSFPKKLIEASYVLGKSRLETFLRVVIPNIKPAIITGAVLTFAHTVGEFGVVLMVGGSIPGETKVASIAIYEEVEALNYDKANLYALVLLAISFFTLFITYLLNKKFSLELE